MTSSNLSDATRVKFSEVRHLLPQDCWAVESERGGNEFQSETVLILDGSHILSSLDLDNPLGDGSPVFLIFVRGSLRVEGTIGNEDTDGASGLVVCGSLTCRNAIVGGQQIYVSENLKVEDLFWGDYSHGELIVNGNASARMFLSTDGYSVSIGGEHQFDRRIFDREGDEGWRLDEADALSEFINGNFVTDDDDVTPLARREILVAVRAGQDVIQTTTAPDKGHAKGNLFPDRDVTAENIRRVAAEEILMAGGDDNAIGSVEFWSTDIFCRINLLPDGKNVTERKLYFQIEEKFAVLIGLFNRPPTFFGRVAAAFQSLVGKPRKQHLLRLWRNVEDNESWRFLDASAPAEVSDLLTRGWEIALQFATTREDISHVLKPQMIRDLLALPLAKPYDDFYSDDRNGLWAHNLYCSFRQENAEPGDMPMLRVTMNEDDTDVFFYEIIRTANESDSVNITHMVDLEEDEHTYPGLTGGDDFERALNVFVRASHNLQRTNRRLLEGERVTDDGFAIKYWREQGYLKTRLP